MTTKCKDCVVGFVTNGARYPMAVTESTFAETVRAGYVVDCYKHCGKCGSAEASEKLGEKAKTNEAKKLFARCVDAGMFVPTSYDGYDFTAFGTKVMQEYFLSKRK